MRRAIVASIDRGTPVIAFGIMGPPEAGLVTGYEDGGDVLHGWSYFDHEPPDTYYRRDNWFARMPVHPPIGAIVLRGKRVKKPTELATAVATLEWAIDLAATQSPKNLPDHVFGTAAYDAWAAALAIDADFPANDDKVMAVRRMLYDDQLMMVSERGHASRYLAHLAKSFPAAAEPLNKASALYKEAGDRASPLSEARTRIADKEVRADAVEHILATRDAEAAAVEELKLAHAILKRPPASATLTPTALAHRDPALQQTPENIPIPAALRAFLEVTGDDFGQRFLDAHSRQWQQSSAYLLMGLTTGEWFQNAWFTRDQQPAPTLTSPLAAEPWQRAMAAAGYQATILVRNEQKPSEDTLRAAVTDSIGVRGLPAILVGVPTPHHVFLATQYDDHGNTLRGWAVTGGQTIRFDETELQTLTGWQKQTLLLVAPSLRITRAERSIVYRQAFTRGLALLRNNEMGAFVAGPATYEAWRKALLDDLPAADEESLHARRVAAIEPLIWDLAERRAWAQVCLDDIAAEMPVQAAELRAAAKAAKQIHDHMWKINELAGGKAPGDRTLPNLANADARAAIAELLSKCQALDAEIAAHLEKSLNP